MDAPAAAWIIFSVAGLILAIAAFVLVWRRGFESAHVELGPVKADLEAIRHTTEAINSAVNNVPKGTPSLPERIGELEAMQRWSVMALRIVGAHTGATLPEPPTRRTP